MGNAVSQEADGFVEGTTRSAVDYAAKRVLTRLADLVVPGSGAVIDALDHLWEAVRALEAVVAGSGEIGIAVGQLDGIDFVIDFRVGGSDGSELPVTAHLAPEEDSLFDGIEITPAHEHGEHAEEVIPPHRDHVLMIEADLSQLMLWQQPSDRSAAVRHRAEQQLVPQVRSTYGDDLELLGAYDPKTGTVALMRLSGSETSWCILYGTSPSRVSKLAEWFSSPGARRPR